MFLRFFKKQPAGPPFWEEYKAGFDNTYSNKTRLETVRFVILDTETTGLEVRNDRILSIAAAGIEVCQMNMEDTFECFLMQTANRKDSAPVHGILEKASNAGLPEEEAVQRFLHFCRDSIIVGHHISFDVSIMNEALKRAGGGKLLNKTVDTARLAIRVEQPFDTYQLAVKPAEYSLDTLCQRYQIPTQERHTAAGDVYITAILFLKLLARLRKRGVTTLGDLLKR